MWNCANRVPKRNYTFQCNFLIATNEAEMGRGSNDRFGRNVFFKRYHVVKLCYFGCTIDEPYNSLDYRVHSKL